MNLALLESPLYSMGEAARLLRIPPPTLRRWLQGAQIAGRFYEPVLRAEPSAEDVVTWAEFVEAGLLREYRSKRVSLQRMRPFIELMRWQFDVPYPLAYFRPLIDRSSLHLVLELQAVSDLADELVLIRPTEGGQLQWSQPVEAFLEKVEFNHDAIAERMRPEGRDSPVVIDPEVVFGIPQIRGVRTETLQEAFATGETIAAIARSWDFDPRDVEAALQWEASLSRKPAA